MKARELHVRIARLVVDGKPGNERAAVVAALTRTLPAAIEARLSAGGHAAPTALHDRIADAVASRVRAQLP
jgi:hypothetical protein